MHEYGIALEIARISLEEASRHGPGRVSRVGVTVGVLRGIVPETLRYLFAHAVAGTPAEGADLAIEEEPVLLSCPGCGEVPSDRFAPDCPRCGGILSGVRGGESLSLSFLEIEEPPGESRVAPGIHECE